jgi:hypothetical protein
MKVKITCPVPSMGLIAGLIYDLDDDVAIQLKLVYMAIDVPADVELIDVQNETDPAPVFVEAKRKHKKEVTDGNG